MITVSGYAKKKGISRHTIYSWIYRNQLEKNGLRLVELEGGIKLLDEIKKKK